MPQSKISRIEAGVIEVCASDLETIVAVFGVSMERFYGRIPKAAKAS